MARYTKDENGNLILTAGGTRTWIVTQEAHDRAVSAGTAPNNCLVAITDDYPTEEQPTFVTKTLTNLTVNSYGAVNIGCAGKQVVSCSIHGTGTSYLGRLLTYGYGSSVDNRQWFLEILKNNPNYSTHADEGTVIPTVIVTYIAD